jgi:hypothetical protein
VVPRNVLIFRFCFNGLKEEVDLPALFVNGRDRRRAEFQVIGQKHQRLLFLVIPHLDLPGKTDPFPQCSIDLLRK